MIRAFLAAVPPRTTSQMKRMTFRLVNGKPKPVFFKKAALKNETAEYGWLLKPYRPAAPLAGPVHLRLVFVYPHLASTRVADLPRLVPKVSRPDCSNVVKAIEDLLVEHEFLVDDNSVFRLEVEKYHGPDSAVGIYIELAPAGVPDGGLETLCQSRAETQVGAVAAGGPRHGRAV